MPCTDPTCDVCTGRAGADVKAVNDLTEKLLDLLNASRDLNGEGGDSYIHGRALAQTLGLLCAKAPSDIRSAFFAVMVRDLFGFFVSMSREVDKMRGEEGAIDKDEAPDDIGTLIKALISTLPQKKGSEEAEPEFKLTVH